MAESVLRTSDGKGKSIPAADRFAAPITKHNRFSMIFQFNAAGGTADTWHLQTTTRTLFVNGADDGSVTSPYLLSGYSETTNIQSPNGGSIMITDAYKGGALSDSATAMILSAGIRLMNPPRIMAVDANNTTASVQVNSGIAGIESAQTDDFYHEALKLCDVQLLPVGNVSGCSAFLAQGMDLQSGYTANSGGVFPTQGRSDGMARYGFRQQIYVEPNNQQLAGFNPNRFLLNFGGNLEANALSGVQRLPALAARADLALLVLDFDLVVWYALVESRPELDKATGQMVDGVFGVDHYNQRVLDMWLSETSYCGL